MLTKKQKYLLGFGILCAIGVVALGVVEVVKWNNRPEPVQIHQSESPDDF